MDGDKSVHVNIYHGGTFVVSPRVRYIGGAVCRRGLVDVDALSVPMMKELVDMFGYMNISQFWWRISHESMEKCKVLESDNDVIALIGLVNDGDTLDIYVEHTIEIQEDVIPLLLGPEGVDGQGVGQTEYNDGGPSNEQEDEDSGMSELAESEGDEDGDLFSRDFQKATNEEIRKWVEKEHAKWEEMGGNDNNASEYGESDELHSPTVSDAEGVQHERHVETGVMYSCSAAPRQTTTTKGTLSSYLLRRGTTPSTSSRQRQ